MAGTVNPAPDGRSSGPLPLDGVRVLDLSRFLAGPYAAMTLGDMGADVIKVERCGSGDDSRRMGPHVAGESYPFAMNNRNKRGIALDLTTRRGHEVFLRLVATADVLIENFRPGVTEGLGIDHASLSAVRPRLIHCSVSGFGQTGPDRERAGLDIIAQGASGLMSMTGHPGEPPVKMGIAANDIAAGSLAVQAVLAAHIHRLRTGEGQHIDISLVDAGLSWTIWEAGAYFGSGEVASAQGSRHRRSAPYQAFRTQDGHVTVGANTDRLWERLVTSVLGRPDWLDDPRYAENASRLRNVDVLETEIEEITTTRPTADWVALLDEAGVPGGPVYTYDQALATPQARAREMVVEVDHPIVGPMRHLGVAPKMSGTPLRIDRAAPWLGQHTTEVLGELGLTEGEIEELFTDGLVDDSHRRR
ncbi:CoA transferase [Streptomyces sp. NPDC048106]|uniref:CaiB/BaiF CoA transferase family protein n=1 Tax=Streptomyces sp. NPDC048106 TaxID=3155750 RepID=UPI003457302A